MSKRTFDDMAYFYKCFLKIIGLLPFDGRDYDFLVSRLLLTYYLTSSTIHWSMFVFYVINGKKMPAVDTICEIVLIIGTEIRFYLLIKHRRQLEILLEESREIWDEFDEIGHQAVREFETKVRRLFKCLLCACYFICIVYSANAFVATINAVKLNSTDHPRYLPSKWYSENGPNLWPGYKFNFVLQVIVVQNACIYGPTVESAAPFLIMIGAGYFRALRYRILRIAECNDDAVELELADCARLHQRLLRYCAGIDVITRKLFVVQLMGTVYNISLAGFKLAGPDSDRYKFIPIAVYQLGGLFICQWSPDHLIQESLAISTAAYFVSLTSMKRRLPGKMLMMIILRSQKSVQLTAAGVVKLSLEKFGSMLTSAVSFFTVLRNSNG